MKCHRTFGKTLTSFDVFFFIFSFFCVSVSGELSEKLALLELKSSFADPSWLLSSWRNSSDRHHCSWFGVSCDSNSRVISLRISASDGEKPGNFRPLSCSQSSSRFRFPFYGFGIRRRRSANREGRLSLRGGISPSIGKLTELRALSLAYHDLSGEIPREIWGLEKLRVLDLEGNSLTGKLPSQFSGLKWLRVLNLGLNRIDGEIPVSLSECGDLEVLNLAGNSLNGTIPEFLGGFSRLKGLYLSRNRLTGSVPEEFGSGCENLEHLDLSGNFLVGRIPGSLGKCRRLRTLLLFSNMLNGNIPRELGGLQMLEVLDVSRNSLGGRIPAELGQCVNLSVFVLSNGGSLIELSRSAENYHNHFEGPIPEEITTLPKLRIVWAPKASLEGKLPSNWGGCENLEMVNLGQNLFKGEVFGVFERCKKLHYLDLSSNQLTGELSEKLPVPCMSVFNVSGNLLSGLIPRFKSRMCANVPMNSDLTKFDDPSFPYKLFFTCQSRRVETSLPFSGPGFIVIHNLSGNNFSGPIQSLPAPLLSNRMIYAFLAGGNKLAGSFPERLFGKCNGLNGLVLNFSNNRFSGHIPMQISVICRSLLSLDVSGNEISGSMPQSLGDLTSLVLLDLSRNKLHGKIPPDMSRLRHLKYLSLAHNSLTGPIPYSFGWFQSLEVLDLSSNSLSGEIPEGLVNSRNLTVLLNNNSLHGKILSGLTNLRSLSTSKFSRVLLNNNVMNCSSVQGKPSQSPCGLTSLAVRSLSQQDTNWSSQTSQSEIASSSGNSGLNSIEIASIASASAIVLVLLALIVLFFYTRKWIPDSRVQGLEPREITVFSNIGAPLTFESIVRATGNFNASNCIGNGGFGATYKADIHPGIIVAVKRLAVGRFHGIQQFHAEVKTLGRVRHPNLVTLIGYHASETEMFLIYNYLPGGNLENFIKESSTRANDWKILHKIALDIAHALAYLHDQCVPRVLHRDVKPSNILLDSNLNAYLSDFGLSRLLGTSETHATTGVAGTFGYLAPEYAMTCRVSDKSDVYSYGVVLLELISDKKPLDPSFSSHGDGFNIVSWASMLLKQGRAKEVFTAGLWDVGPHDDLVEMLHLAVTCTNETLSIRPTMKHVVQRLKKIQPLIIR
ncbi:LRR receptor-like serine/threonine-protein kinase RPK2 [Morus notabilis]|uniref:non-specific serine/threonine protein kinase n=1 Tax=Morus notabilis TaxID=981085 RepID=W9QW86_9ROSA|nr:LRR receptor-like serine/threonine-protein kinase RPK2 [Morus notabilis]EXB44848.1 LRR receptor-like serine/threonine-protein kinase RPK2 [Morus notabilis]